MPVPMAVIMARISSCAEHFVVAGFLDVQDLSLERKNRLIAAVAAGFRGAAGRFALDQEQLAAVRIFFLAIGQLARQTAGIERAFAPREIARFAGGFAGTRGIDRLADDLLHHRRILIEELAQFLVDQLNDVALNIGIQLALGLAFELGLRKLYADDGGETFAHVVAGQVFFRSLIKPGLRRRGIDGAGQRAAKAAQMRAAIDRIDVVGETEYVFRVGIVVLQRHFNGQLAAVGQIAVAFEMNRLIVQDDLPRLRCLMNSAMPPL